MQSVQVVSHGVRLHQTLFVQVKSKLFRLSFVKHTINKEVKLINSYFAVYTCEKG